MKSPSGAKGSSSSAVPVPLPLPCFGTVLGAAAVQMACLKDPLWPLLVFPKAARCSLEACPSSTQRGWVSSPWKFLPRSTVCEGCCNEVQAGWLTHYMCGLTVLGAGGPRPRCQEGCFFLRAGREDLSRAALLPSAGFLAILVIPCLVGPSPDLCLPLDVAFRLCVPASDSSVAFSLPRHQSY